MGAVSQNITGVATGLALCGQIIFTYSIANFPIVSCLEWIRNDTGYHGLSVKIVAVSGGLAYRAVGYTRHAVEILAVMRAMPNMTVVAPDDPADVRLATQVLVEQSGLFYVRFTVSGAAMGEWEPSLEDLVKCPQSLADSKTCR